MATVLDWWENNGVGKKHPAQYFARQDFAAARHSQTTARIWKLVTFDQLRRKLELDKSVAENVAGGKDYIRINGKDRHVVGYLKGFLFSPKRAMTPVKALSGGERNRIILAKLFTKPTNLLVLDEPTNDLDVETLEVLEQRLVEYPGTLIVVSHDREFLDNVVTSILVFEADGSIREYVGGYRDWVRRHRELAAKDDPNKTRQRGKNDASRNERRKPTKLSSPATA